MRAMTVFPMAMGGAMGVMMPFMLHSVGAAGALWFVLAHVAVLAVAVLLVGSGLARFWPVLAARIRSHRPSLAHLALMGAGMALGFAGLHVMAELGGLH